MTRALIALFLSVIALPAFAQPEQDVRDLLSRMHEATKAADHETYFDLFTDDAVFFGTDIWERWPRDEFESLYRPYMESGRGWWFEMRNRHVDVQPAEGVALFDETLYSESYGQCRGTGAARLVDGEWKLVRYHLDITLPNPIATDLVEQIRAHEANTIELITFNIRYDTDRDGDNAWPHRAEIVSDIIRREHPDIVGVQEALHHQLNTMAKDLPGYEWTGVGRSDGKSAGEFAPIFYNADKLRLIEGSTFWFSGTPDVPGSTSFGNTIPRICTWGHFGLVHDTDAPGFIVANVHLDHQSDESRLKSMKQLESWIDDQSLPVFVLGDFNCTPNSAPMRTLIGDGWQPAVSEDDAMGTYHAFTGKADRRIDMILVPDSCAVTEAEIIDEGGSYADAPGVWPSDHYPVRAIVTLKPEDKD